MLQNGDKLTLIHRTCAEILNKYMEMIARIYTIITTLLQCIFGQRFLIIIFYIHIVLISLKMIHIMIPFKSDQVSELDQF